MTAIPDSQIGVLRDEESFQLKQFPVPEPGPDEVLIRNVAVASNPKDWKHPRRFNDYSYIEGSDIAGTIAKLGEGVVGFEIGQRVAAFTKMATKQNKVSAMIFNKNKIANIAIYCSMAVTPNTVLLRLLQRYQFRTSSILKKHRRCRSQFSRRLLAYRARWA